MKIRLIIYSLLFLLAVPAGAQKRKKPVRPQEPSPEEMARQERLQRMTDNTERIMFIDSIVVDKADFLKAYKLHPEAGLIDSYEHYFKSARQPNAYVYVNALGNKCYLAQANNEGIMNLYYSETLNKKWTRPTRLHGLNNERQFRHSNYPFMMGDGQTLYFAAEGEESIGGYDIFMTNYDEENQQFLRPVNIGMPFNSEANDYLYVIDEYNNLGWFATDRRQPEGKVCIYTFVPNKGRKMYLSDDYTPEQVSRFAAITSIRDTWDDQQQLQQALVRLHEATHRLTDGSPQPSFRFVINDDVTYHQLSDFKAAGNAERYQQLVRLQIRQQALDKALQHARDYYATASGDDRDDLKSEILASEQKQYDLSLEIHQTEKAIRNAEIIFLTKIN